MTFPILLTGVSSFTGHAFALKLSDAGFHVVGTLTRERASYQDPYLVRRLRRLENHVEIIDRSPVGSERFLEVLRSLKPHIACLHHAVVGDYKAVNFDISGAIAAATFNCDLVSSTLADHGCKELVLTRSVFEAGQGLSDDPSPIGGYAIAKTATVDTWKLSARRNGLQTRDFTITNPIGPYEQPRLPKYLLSTWLRGTAAELSAPSLVRDNVPIDLLSGAYAEFVLGKGKPRAEATPSFWIASNLDFSRRMAEAYRSMLGLDCLVVQANEIQEFEPRLRAGLDLIQTPKTWLETEFWQTHADYWLPILKAEGDR